MYMLLYATEWTLHLTGKTIKAALGANPKSNKLWDISDSVKSLLGYVPHSLTEGRVEPTC